MADLGKLLKQSASEIGRVLARGEVSPLDLSEYALDQIKSFPDPSMFLCLTGARARREAQASTQRLSMGKALSALDGVPIGYKDLIDIEGETTTAGSAVYRDAPLARKDARIVANASAAGMVTIGKLNLTEFAYSGIGLNPHFGTPLNPHGRDRACVPGGSSSGSAVAVAAGLLPVAIGTDTGGSVRIPASFNGLVGYKSSEGRISTDGVFPLSPTLDTLGPLARSVEDCVHLERILRGKSTCVTGSTPLAGKKFIVPQGRVLDDLDGSVASNFAISLKRLEAAGASIEAREMVVFSEVSRLAEEFGTIAMAEAYAFHKALVESERVLMVDRRVVARILGGRSMSVSDLKHLHTERKNLIEALRAQIGENFVLMPTTPMTAPEIAPLEADDDLFHRINLKALRNTSVGNFLNMPGLALPNGSDGAGLPTSILVSATHGRDDALLGIGLSIEKIVST